MRVSSWRSRRLFTEVQPVFTKGIYCVKLRRPHPMVANLKKKSGAPAAKGASLALNERLKLLRRQHEMSLETLAGKTGLTKGFLSLVERGLKAPSISTIMSLSEAFAVPVGRLFDERRPDDQAYSLVRRKDRKKYAREGSLFGYKYEALAFRKDRKLMEPFVVVPPRRTPRKFFQHPGDEMVFVLSGIVETHLGS